MRTFIAVSLPADVQDILGQLQNMLKEARADVNWAAPSNIHLTLKFLGETSEKNLPLIIEAMASAARAHHCFSVRIGPIGAFPSNNAPRIIWAGFDRGTEEIVSLARGLEEEIARRAGIPKEKRPFSAHITIGRIRSELMREDLVQRFGEAESWLKGKDCGFQVTNLVFFKSTLTARGPIYTPLMETSLATT